MSLTPISFTGISKFSDDFQVILERSFEVATLPIQNLQAEQARLITQQSDLGDLQNSLQSLEQSLASLGLLGAKKAVTANTSDAAVATVNVVGTPDTLSFDLNVTSAASAAQEATLTGLADTDATPLTADGISKLTLDTATTTIDLLTIGSGRTAGTTGAVTPATPVSVQVDFSNGLSGSITADLNSFFVATSPVSGATAGDTVSVTFVSEDSSINETINLTLSGGETAASLAGLLNTEIAGNANLSGKLTFSDEGGNLKLVESDTVGQGFTFSSSSTGSVSTGLEGGGTVGGHSEEEIAAALNVQVALDAGLTAAGVSFVAQDGEVRVKGTQKFDVTVTDNAQGTGFLSGLVGTQTVEGFDNTLAGLRDFINANSTTLGVKAAIINTSSDPGNPSNHLTITATATGTATLKLEDSATVNLVTASNQGTDAVFTVNGLSVTNSSNTISDFAPGLSISIGGPGTTTISAGTDAASISNALADLAVDFNAVVDKIQAQIGEDAGLLSGHPQVRQAQQTLRELTSFTGSGTIKSMVEIGLELDDKGKLSFNNLTFNALTGTGIQDALAFIGDTVSGFAGSGFTKVKDLSDPVTGQIATAIDFLEESDTGLAAQIEEEQERVDLLIANLEAQFAAADLLLAQLESQESLLTSLFDSQSSES